MVNLLSGQSLRYYNEPVAHLKLNVIRWHSDTDGFGYQAEIMNRLLIEGASYIEVQVPNIDRDSGVTSAFSIKNFLAVGLWGIAYYKYFCADLDGISIIPKKAKYSFII